ncbi:5'-methylthioadenosine/S-adenosylhomocysteine nucleosidase [Candidatus Erwinia haradaeae]|uniref:5'-methylthioadenosine/S-adenosylhomocysteine nucleosidase n=1 Tax=Candidatus Erwinia haradaeae TaxID=1922217 RepID=A0A451D444_9GAMM|nr:5'-methylthioadenosine/S-adenosylhomocysteine nucleosidase [Candidatus Erwinia haradaeae]VFP80457.1 5'-methylthioadenosine/S-adenosylhomocysteine nucleosidase [Candidatus Erwinia haradaeae]
MKVGIIGAMEEEVNILRDQIKKRSKMYLSGAEIDSGLLGGVEILLIKSGIGKVLAALSTTLLINLYKINILINIGSAGGLHPELKIGDIVISSAVQYHDVDVTTYGCQLGQVPNCPFTFQADHNLITIAESCIQKLSLFSIRGIIVTGDTFIQGNEPLQRIRYYFPKAIAVDMEAAAIGHVCHQSNIPFIIIRSISDFSNKNSPSNFHRFLKEAAQKSSLVVENILACLI